MIIRSVEEIKEKFSKMHSREDVADILEIQDKSLRYFLYKRRPENMYTQFSISKRDGGERIISAPMDKLKQIQKKLAYILNIIYEPKVCAYGFIENKNIVDNASQHLKRRLLLNIDLENFFTQIHFGRIRGMLIKPPYNLGNEAAVTIAQIACLNGVLPQGAPSSPVLTNMICVPMDNSLMQLAKKNGCTYTRYADDITISTFYPEFPEKILKSAGPTPILGEDIISVFNHHSFKINSKKISLNGQNTRQEVTGLTVNIFPNLRRHYIRNLRAMLYNCEKRGAYFVAKEYVGKGLCKNKKIIEVINDPDKEKVVITWFMQVICGKINYIKQVKGEASLTFLSFAKKANEVFKAKLFNVEILDDLDILARELVYIVESKSKECQGSGFYIENYGMLTSYHVTENGDLFYVYKHTCYDENPITNICKTINEIESDQDIDYALYEAKIQSNTKISIGDSTRLRTRDQVTIIGYPNYIKGNSPYIQTCHITSKKFFMGAPFYTVSGRIVHGASGGIVLNNNKQVVGVIKGGVISMEETDGSENQGFIPIHIILEDINTKQIEAISESASSEQVS